MPLIKFCFLGLVLLPGLAKSDYEDFKVIWAEIKNGQLTLGYSNNCTRYNFRLEPKCHSIENVDSLLVTLTAEGSMKVCPTVGTWRQTFNVAIANCSPQKVEIVEGSKRSVVNIEK